MPEDDPFAHIRVSESHDSRNTSRSSDDAQCRQFFSVQGALSAAEAEARIRAQSKPPEVTYSATVAVDVQPVFFDRAHPENNLFEVTRTYAKKQNEVEEESGISWTFSTSSSTTTCTEARRAVAAPGSYPFWTDPEEPPEGHQPGQGSPINVRKVNGRMETGGIEITVSTLKLDMSFECTVDEWLVLKPAIIRKRSMVNSDAFFGWQPEELFFLDFNISNQTPEIISVSYSFSVSPCEDYTAGPFTIPQAPGWSVKWSYWGEEEEIELEDGTKQVRPKCSGAYASGTYLRTMFKSLLPPRLTAIA